MKRREFLKTALPAAATATLAAQAGNARDTPRSACDHAASQIMPAGLRCESRLDPLGIDAARPRLSWKLQAVDGARGQVQTAYRVVVATTQALLDRGTPDLWDSGRVDSAQQLHVEYDGRPLGSGDRACWRVQIWDRDGNVSAPSEPAYWEMGLLAPGDWTGYWISDDTPQPATDEAQYDVDPAPLFRRTFRVEKPVRRARLYATGLGYCEVRLNGRKTSDRALDPAWTDFDRRVYYTTDDVTDRLRPGENVLGAMLGNGWFNPLPLRMWGRINIREHLPVGRPTLMAQLVIEFEDGTTLRIATDDRWKTAPGPILRNSVYLGETYDARDERPGWDAPGFNDAKWRTATRAARPPRGGLQALPVPPIRITATLKPHSVHEVEPGVHIFDLGQNIAGWVRLRVRGPRGTTVRMRMGERLYDDGTLNPMTVVAGQIKGLNQDGTPRGGPGAPEIAWQENRYTLRGDGPEEFTPRFTFHGFRYVEVTGYPGTPGLDAIEGLRLNTDVERAGTFSSSNDRLNRIDEMVRWTLLGNLFSVQSDCPGREKFQYGGDIVATSEMAIFGHDMAAFYAKTVSDHRDATREGWFTETAPYVGISAASYAPQAAPIGWGLAHPLLVSQLYRYYGDRRLVEEHFEPARRWVDLLEAHSDGLIIDRCIGDHESLDPKPIELIATAHFHQAASLVADFATILQRPGDAARYRRLAGDIRGALVERFLDPGTGMFDTGTQAAQATILHLGLVPDGEWDAAVRRMVDEVVVTHGGHVATGIFGTKYLLESLSRTGHAEVAYRMVDTPDYPGWGYMLERGATTVWETWKESDNVYSNNHPMFGSVGEWLFKSLAGIRPEPGAVGFDRFRVEPDTPDGLDWVRTRYESVRGPVVSRWRRDADRFNLEVEIPVGATATVRIPTSDHDSVREGGRPVDGSRAIRRLGVSAPGYVSLEVGSGRYAFEASA